MATGNDKFVRSPAITQKFLNSLYDMVENPSCDHLIRWSTFHGDACFVVTDPYKLSKEQFPRYFRHSNWSSFARQLCMYEFQKVGDSSEYVYMHPLFKPKRVDLIALMKRKKAEENPTRETEANKEEELQTLLRKIEALQNAQTEANQRLERVVAENKRLYKVLAKHEETQVLMERAIVALVARCFKTAFPNFQQQYASTAAPTMDDLCYNIAPPSRKRKFLGGESPTTAQVWMPKMLDAPPLVAPRRVSHRPSLVTTGPSFGAATAGTSGAPRSFAAAAAAVSPFPCVSGFPSGSPFPAASPFPASTMAFPAASTSSSAASAYPAPFFGFPRDPALNDGLCAGALDPDADMSLADVAPSELDDDDDRCVAAAASAPYVADAVGAAYPAARERSDAAVDDEIARMLEVEDFMNSLCTTQLAPPANAGMVLEQEQEPSSPEIEAVCARSRETLRGPELATVNVDAETAEEQRILAHLTNVMLRLEETRKERHALLQLCNNYDDTVPPAIPMLHHMPPPDTDAMVF